MGARTWEYEGTPKDIGILIEWLHKDDSNRVRYKKKFFFSDTEIEYEVSLDDNMVIVESLVTEGFEHLSQYLADVDCIYKLLFLVEQLKDTPPENKDTMLKSRWEEIEFDVVSSRALLSMNKDR